MRIGIWGPRWAGSKGPRKESVESVRSPPTISRLLGGCRWGSPETARSIGKIGRRRTTLQARLAIPPGGDGAGAAAMGAAESGGSARLGKLDATAHGTGGHAVSGFPTLSLINGDGSVENLKQLGPHNDAWIATWLLRKLADRDPLASDRWRELRTERGSLGGCAGESRRAGRPGPRRN